MNHHGDIIIIVRNSTKLLFGHKMDIITYVIQSW